MNEFERGVQSSSFNLKSSCKNPQWIWGFMQKFCKEQLAGSMVELRNTGHLKILTIILSWPLLLRVRSAGLGRSVCQCVPAGNTDPLPCHAQSQAVTYCHVLARAKEDGDKECPHSQGHFHPTTRKRDKSIKTITKYATRTIFKAFSVCNQVYWLFCQTARLLQFDL